MLSSNLTVGNMQNLFLSRKLVWFTDDGISGREFMTCTWGNAIFCAILQSTLFDKPGAFIIIFSCSRSLYPSGFIWGVAFHCKKVLKFEI